MLLIRRNERRVAVGIPPDGTAQGNDGQQGEENLS